MCPLISTLFMGYISSPTLEIHQSVLLLNCLLPSPTQLYFPLHLTLSLQGRMSDCWLLHVPLLDASHWFQILRREKERGSHHKETIVSQLSACQLSLPLCIILVIILSSLPQVSFSKLFSIYLENLSVSRTELSLHGEGTFMQDLYEELLPLGAHPGIWALLPHSAASSSTFWAKLQKSQKPGGTYQTGGYSQTQPCGLGSRAPWIDSARPSYFQLRPGSTLWSSQPRESKIPLWFSPQRNCSH